MRRTRQFRKFVSALAILGAALNAWVLSVHLTSVALTSMRADVVICGQKRAATAPWSGDGKSIPRNHCPICSGLAVLHIGVLTDAGLGIPSRTAPMLVVSETMVAYVLDRRPDRLLNRGPPPYRA
ncbi:MAG: hypothetical protein JSR78_13070 [Proteobacteria bacterium]|nr:hypothetical protein [Pseudomonadota bacterium]